METLSDTFLSCNEQQCEWTYDGPLTIVENLRISPGIPKFTLDPKIEEALLAHHTETAFHRFNQIGGHNTYRVLTHGTNIFVGAIFASRYLAYFRRFEGYSREEVERFLTNT